jgi:parallel beta-helix repeat protein
MTGGHTYLTIFLIITVGIATAAIEVRKTEATGWIYIKGDGSVEGTSYIATIDNSTYTFTHSIVNSLIVVQRDNILLDGNSFLLDGSGASETGILLDDVNGVVVKGTRVTGFEIGIAIGQGSGNSIYGNSIYGNEETGACGIVIGSTENNVSENDVYSNYNGILVWGNSNNVVWNLVHNNGRTGVEIWGSNNILRNNTIHNNPCNFGLGFPGLENDVDISNTVDGRPIYYWVRKRDMKVPTDAGYLVLVNCARITVENLTISHNEQGIYLCSTSEITVTNNTIRGCISGISLFSSRDNYISFNTLTNIIFLSSSDVRYDIVLRESSSNQIVSNQILQDPPPIPNTGIALLDNSSSNTVTRNRLIGNNLGIYLSGSNSNIIKDNVLVGSEVYTVPRHQIDLDRSCYNEIAGNRLTKAETGIGFRKSSYNTINNNEIDGNTKYGIHLTVFSGSDNIFFSNNLLSNDAQVYSESEETNIWDYQGIGNYWSDYQTLYPNATAVGNPRIWSIPYNIDAHNVDGYPLAEPAIISEFQWIFLLPIFIAMTFLVVSFQQKRFEHTRKPSC